MALVRRLLGALRGRRRRGKTVTVAARGIVRAMALRV